MEGKMKSTKKLLIVVAVVLGLVMGSVGIAYAITNGEPDAGRHPYVGLLVFDSAPGSPAWRCSGALIAPDVVLTAGHCTDGAYAARFWLYEDMTYDNVPFPLYPYGGRGSGAIEGTPYTNPKYRSPENPYGGGNGLPAFSYRDVGVVVLEKRVPKKMVGEYAQLPSAGLVDTLENKTDVDLNPGGGTGGLCFGDSGGPDLLAGTNTVLAVNSYVTNYNCSGVGYSARVDIPEVLDWINGFLK
jgi:hypothetical protein